MNIRLNRLVLHLKKSEEVIEFADVSYFYGQMGSGKTSIARLIDYALGGDFEYTPALQQEFISVSLDLSINGNALVLHRPRDANSLIATYSRSDGDYQHIIPIAPDGEIIPNTDVENLSDFIFYIGGMKPPKVRKSKVKEESALHRLSVRNLLWYCYLDQDEIDSDFFHLGLDANSWKRLASRDVLRFIVGFHQEKVSELEEELAELRDRRRALSSAAKTLQQVLRGSSINTYEDLHNEIESLKLKETEVAGLLGELRSNAKAPNRRHAVDTLRTNARNLFFEIEALDASVGDVKKLIQRDSRLLNEIKMLKIKIKRDESAKKALMGVSYSSCPSCLRSLPERDMGCCAVCGQDVSDAESAEQGIDVFDKDADSRISELNSALEELSDQLRRLELKRGAITDRKKTIDLRLNEMLSEYDSAYLSSILNTERELISVKEKILSLQKLQELPLQVERLQREADSLTPEIKDVSETLKGAEQVKIVVA